jgi:D-beta-D-heptose 7-phosphate kinase/D-beta-D-heptose 1-phosphate adenosyltransferase
MPYYSRVMAKAPRRRGKHDPKNDSHPGHAPALPEVGPVRVMVAGEVILDRYLHGDVSRISAEAPIPILHVTRREEKPGNAGFVMANLRALGAEVSALSVVGGDRDGRLLREIFRGLGIGMRTLLTDPERRTTVKTRMLGSVQAANRATQQLLRVDEEDTRAVGSALERDLVASLKRELPRVDGVLIADINKGLLTPKLMRALIDGANRRKVPVIVDPRITEDFSIYRGATAITPNRFETETATGIKLTDRDAWRAAGEKLIRELGLQACLITLDRDGMYLVEDGGPGIYIPTAPREVYDVTGAGDVVLSTFGLFSIAGLGFSSAARMANLAASIEVTRLGTEVISREDLARALTPQHQSYERKIVSPEELKTALARDRRNGKAVVFTNGCFDLIHAGHLRLLNFARAQGDLLVVGLNSDRSVRELKGKGRPIYPAAERARILAAMEAVDYVILFDEPRAEKVVRLVRPDVLVKGEDYRGQVVDGQKFIESYGGRVALAPLVEGKSTTETIKSLKQREAVG